jgi:tRNA pseudouridine55 synthase
MTSHDVVERVRRRFRTPGAGHLGTLDPAASGLLLIALGPATRVSSALQGGTKTYEARIRFGVTTSTQDLAGEVVARSDRLPEAAAVRAESEALVGEIDQVPPMASAVKVQGQRLHRLHRRGVTIERAPRRITVFSWEWIDLALPEATFRVRCSGGTYVRTLAHDLGERLGSGAALAALRRLRSEPFGLDRSVTLDRIVKETPDTVWPDAGYSLEQALAHLPGVTLEPDEAEAIGFGRRITLAGERAGEAPPVGRPRSVVLRDRDGRVLGLGERLTEDGGEQALRPRTLMPWAVRDGRLTRPKGADPSGPQAL